MKLAVINLKGGSGKTTSAVYLAAALARRGLHGYLFTLSGKQG